MDTQTMVTTLRVYEQSLRTQSTDLVAHADILANAASQLEGTLVTQLADLETMTIERDQVKQESQTKDATIADLETQVAALTPAEVAPPPADETPA